MVDETDVRAWVKDEVARQLKERDTRLNGRPLIDPVPVINALDTFFDEGKLWAFSVVGLTAIISGAILLGMIIKP